MADTNNNDNIDNFDSDDEVKQLEINKAKKQNSYTYWVNNDPNFFKGVQVEKKGPKKIDDPTLIQDAGKPVTGHSAWNTAGTWEEKKLSADIVKGLIDKHLAGYQTPDGLNAFRKVKNLTGDITVVLSRGKKRLGYNLKFTLVFKGTNDLKDSKVRFEFNEFEEDGEMDYNITCSGDAGNLLRDSVNVHKDDIVKRVVAAIETLKDQR
eukprot:TRINITY_DN3477_c0_g1_i1.p1 TRINITY_DN3477_c0_g1~~TRINITY_DN3477_c0_g1_i1.p1  ORF type:complete len:208 (+),score=65.68 TRINITY_DN3477_c0_g1_i1:194-817(+)